MTEAELANADALLDANIIVAICCDPQDPRFERLALMDEDGRSLLIRLLGSCKSLLTIPQALAEASNLLGQKAGRDLRLARLRTLVTEVLEQFVPSRSAVAEDGYRYLGLTDAALLVAAGDRSRTLLTMDALLHDSAARLGLKSVNFNHIRGRYLT